MSVEPSATPPRRRPAQPDAATGGATVPDGELLGALRTAQRAAVTDLALAALRDELEMAELHLAALRLLRERGPAEAAALVSVSDGAIAVRFLDGHLDIDEQAAPTALLLAATGAPDVLQGAASLCGGEPGPGWTVRICPEQPPLVLVVAAADAGPAAPSLIEDVAAVLSGATQREQAREQLQRSEARFRALAEQVPDAVFRLRTRGGLGVEYLNQRFEELAGLPLSTYQRDPHAWLALVPDEDRPAVEPLLDLRGRAQVTSAPYRIVRPDGDVRWVETRVVPERDRDGRVVAVTGATRDITDRYDTEVATRRALEREQAAAEELREVGELKTALLAAVSHELRTPLTAVRGFAELLVQHGDRLDGERRTGALAAIHRNARRLEELLGDLLDLDRLDRGVAEPLRRAVDLGELVTGVINHLDVGPRTLLVDVDVPPAELDGPKVERIVENLVANALAHAGPRARVWIRAEQTDEGTVLQVDDDGPGVPHDHRERIFAPFERGSAADPASGTGIGLSLVARFAELHGGRAWVEDRPGGGASFRVLLPGSASAD